MPCGATQDGQAMVECFPSLLIGQEKDMSHHQQYRRQTLTQAWILNRSELILLRKEAEGDKLAYAS